MTLQHQVKKSPDFVFEYLTDMQKFAAVHPVITKIENISGNNYLIYETLKFGFIPYSFRYTAIVESNRDTKTVFMHATVMKITHIEMTFVLRPEGNFTIVEETVNFKSPLPIKSFLERTFKKLHPELFKNIESMKNE